MIIKRRTKRQGSYYKSCFGEGILSERMTIFNFVFCNKILAKRSLFKLNGKMDIGTTKILLLFTSKLMEKKQR